MPPGSSLGPPSDESRLMANWLKGQKWDIERVLVSPFLRAEQTLDVVGDCMNLPAQVSCRS